MRKVAQPVAVITCNLHDPSELRKPGERKLDYVVAEGEDAKDPDPRMHKDHGATVSSFVSISLSPSPLVAFALRLPSRLAALLNSDKLSTRDLPSINIHLLSEQQESLARAFARQPTKPQEATYLDPKPSPTFEPFPQRLFDELEQQSLGKLQCTIIGSVPLQEPLTAVLGPGLAALDAEPGKANPIQATSQLFIAEALEVKVNGLEQKPLLYCHQAYYGLAEK